MRTIILPGVRPKVIRTRRLKRVRRPKRGGAITDYLAYVPGYNTAAGYINGAYGTYQDAKNIYNSAQGALKTYKEYKPFIDQVVNPRPLPPPVPPMLPGKNYDRPSDLEHNKRLREALKVPSVESQTLRGPMIHPLIKGSALEPVYEFGQKYKPISFIDNTLQRIGLRDKVRGYLGQSKLGKSVVSLADEAMRFGFGRRRKVKKQTRRRIIKKGGRIIFM